jgi:hypothetical protein
MFASGGCVSWAPLDLTDDPWDDEEDGYEHKILDRLLG